MTNETRNEGRIKRWASLLKEFFPAPYAAGMVVYCGLIFYLSSIPSPPIPFHFPYLDKIVHFFLFGGLGAVVAMGLRRAAREYSVATRIIVPIALCFLYGLSDETHQLFVSERMFDLVDVAADVLGAAAAAGLLSLLFIRRSDSTG